MIGSSSQPKLGENLEIRSAIQKSRNTDPTHNDFLAHLVIRNGCFDGIDNQLQLLVNRQTGVKSLVNPLKNVAIEIGAHCDNFGPTNVDPRTW